MLRREALRLLASTVAIPAIRGLDESQVFVLGRRIHAAARGGDGRGVRALDEHQQATVAAAAERIIPATDTPGATDARVGEFIDRMLAQWYPPEDRDRFLAGLAELDARARIAHGRAFAECTPAAQTALLTALDDEVAALRRGGTATSRSAAEAHWFSALKFLTIWGYCTSEAAQTAVLGAWPLPGRFDGCARV